VLYWKEVPVQVQASDGSGQASVQLGPRFQQAVDAVAMFDGSAGSEAYLAAWEWSGYSDVPGSAREAAQAVAAQIEQRAPAELVSLIRDAHRAGTRVPAPGGLDRLVEKRAGTAG
jgi:hypothetical protein